MKKFIAYVLTLCSFYGVSAAPLSTASGEKTENGIPVIFMGSQERDTVLFLAGASVGMADEVFYPKIATLLSYVFLQKIKKELYGMECNVSVGYDQTVYYLYGKVDELEAIIKTFAKVIENFSCTEEELAAAKKDIETNSAKMLKADKLALQHAALQSLYWHSGYGNDEYSSENLDVVTPSVLQDFFKNHYKNSALSFVILGRNDRPKTLKLIGDVLKKNVGESKFERLKEPSHHGACVEIKYDSSQTDVIVMNCYWKIIPYKVNRNEALAHEIFIEHLKNVLPTKLIEEQKVALSLSFKSESWNRDYGDVCITVTSREELEYLKLSVLNTIKTLAYDGMTKQEIENALKNITARANFYSSDALDAIDWVSKKISAGYSWEFLKTFAKSKQSYDEEKVNEAIKDAFNKNPDVIAIMNPKKEDKNAV